MITHKLKDILWFEKEKNGKVYVYLENGTRVFLSKYQREYIYRFCSKLWWVSTKDLNITNITKTKGD